MIERIATLRPVSYPDDIKKIKESVLEVSHLAMWEIEELWEAYSDNVAASWVIVCEGTIKDFIAWLYNKYHRR